MKFSVILIIFILFFYKLTFFFGTIINKLILVAMPIYLILSIIISKKKIKLNKFIIINYGLLFLIYMFNSLINTTINLEYLYAFAEILISYFFIQKIFSYLKLKEKYYVLYYVLFFNIIFSFMELFNIFNMKFLILEINKWNVLNENNFSFFRVVGLFSGYDLNSIFIANFIIFNIYFIKKNKIIAFILTIISTILLFAAARTGIVYLFVIFIFMLFYYKETNKKDNFLFKIVKILLKISVIITAIYMTYLYFQEYFEKIFSRTFEMFINYMENKKIKTDSTDELTTMYVLPKNNFQMIFGDGLINSNRKGQIGYSDVGYIQLIWTYGVIGLIYLIYIYIFNFIIILKLNTKKESAAKKVLLGTILAIVIISFKGPYFFSIPLLNYCYMLYFIIKDENNKGENNNDNINNNSNL